MDKTETCALCGRQPAAGFAMINDKRYCHPDVGWSCYVAAQRGVTSEQLAELPMVCPTCGGTGEVWSDEISARTAGAGDG